MHLKGEKYKTTTEDEISKKNVQNYLFNKEKACIYEFSQWRKLCRHFFPEKNYSLCLILWMRKDLSLICN